MAGLSTNLETSLSEFDYSLIEFRQSYSNGQKVLKRGLDATPVVVRKYGLSHKEVMCFSNHEKRNWAMSAFHFHPDFPIDQRRPYMEAHQEGYELALEIESQRVAERQLEQSKWIKRLTRSGKTIGVLAHAFVFYVMTHHPDSH